MKREIWGNGQGVGTAMVAKPGTATATQALRGSDNRLAVALYSASGAERVGTTDCTERVESLALDGSLLYRPPCPVHLSPRHTF